METLQIILFSQVWGLFKMGDFKEGFSFYIWWLKTLRLLGKCQIESALN